MRSRNLKYIAALQLVVDVALIYFSLIITYLLRFESGIFSFVQDHLPYETYIFPVYFLVPIYLTFNYIAGQYKSNRKLSFIYESVDLLKSHTASVLLFLAILFTQRNIDYSRVFILLFAAILFITTIFSRFLLIIIKLSIQKQSKEKHKILIVGLSNVSKEYIKRTNEHNVTSFEIIGILDNDFKLGYTFGGVKVLGRYNDLSNFLKANEISEVIIAVKLSEFDQINTLVDISETYGVYTKFIPDYYQYIPNRPYIEDYEGLPIISIRKIPLNDLLNRFIKRTLDVIFSFLGICFLSPFLLVICLLIKVTSKGPVLFKQVRVGLNKTEFTIYKFRSMAVQNPDEEKVKWTKKNDTRVTSIGRFMRRTNIDELPQLFNVLKGDMSLIGPRPERPYFVDQFMHTIPKYMIKHHVRPGMSGWAQVHGWRGDTSIEERIKHDIYYIENWSLLLDIRILLMTIFKRTTNKNAY